METKWSSLNTHQVGKYAEYYVKLHLTKYGLDVYTTEVDDKGIDFVLRINSRKYIDIQVKSVRGRGYIYMTKDKFQLRDNLYLALIVFIERKEPLFAMIPSMDWHTDKPSYLTDYDYVDKKSRPEYGIRITKKSIPMIMEKYAFKDVIPSVING